jgi:hypothetical protein
MHAQSASRISGRTRTAVSAMCVRALRITVLKSAGSFTRDECHDLNAEKIQRVKCFMFTRCGICCGWQFSNAGAAGWVRKFLAMVNWRKWQFTSHVRFTPPEADIARWTSYVRNVPGTDSCTAANNIAILSPRPLVRAASLEQRCRVSSRS